jgi:hypothetical protein
MTISFNSVGIAVFIRSRPEMILQKGTSVTSFVCPKALLDRDGCPRSLMS